MPVTLSEAARRLGLTDNREVKGMARILRIRLSRQGEANMWLMDEKDLERIREELRSDCHQSCNQN